MEAPPAKGRPTPRRERCSPADRHRASRQLELYLDKLKILERELEEHRAAGRREAADDTHAQLRAERALIRKLCDDHELERPPGVGSENDD